jgi:hypothetical protein
MAAVSGMRTIVSKVASGNLNFAEPANYRFVRAIGNDDVLLPSASGQQVFGVLQNKPMDNEHASVCIHGPTKITLGISLGANARVMTSNSGYAIAADSAVNQCGYLMTGATSGTIGEMFFTAPSSV